jgi:hypothetical protein
MRVGGEKHVTYSPGFVSFIKQNFNNFSESKIKKNYILYTEMKETYTIYFSVGFLTINM